MFAIREYRESDWQITWPILRGDGPRRRHVYVRASKYRGGDSESLGRPAGKDFRSVRLEGANPRRVLHQGQSAGFGRTRV